GDRAEIATQLIHVEGAADLELERMDMVFGPTEGRDQLSASIRVVDRQRQRPARAEPTAQGRQLSAQGRFGEAAQLGPAGVSASSAEHEISADAARHRVSIEHHRVAEPLTSTLDQELERAVVRTMEAVDAGPKLRVAQAGQQRDVADRGPPDHAAVADRTTSRARRRSAERRT